MNARQRRKAIRAYYRWVCGPKDSKNIPEGTVFVVTGTNQDGKVVTYSQVEPAMGPAKKFKTVTSINYIGGTTT